MCCLLAAASAPGEVPTEPPSTGSAESSWRVVIVSKFSLPQVSEPIAGAKEAVFSAAEIVTGTGGKEKAIQELRLMNRDAFTALGVDWNTFSAKAAVNASADLAKIQPEIIRDKQDVIECAILRAPAGSNDITPVVLAPDFLKRFTPLFGRKMLVAIPDRETIFVFPKLASRYQDYAERVLTVFRASKSPVSREVFELSETGLRAIGEYQER